MQQPELSQNARKLTASHPFSDSFTGCSFIMSSTINFPLPHTCQFTETLLSTSLNSKELQRRIQAMEMRCYRKILHVSYKDHVTNEEVCAKIQQAIGPHEDLLTIVKRRRLQWYGHVSRSSGLAKTILQGTVKGGRR